MPATLGVLYGSIEPIPLPAFIDPNWPLPDMHTSEAFCSKLVVEFTAVMIATPSGSFGHVQWFMPMHIMVDLFANTADNIRWTTTLFFLKFSTDELLGNLMDQGWNTKYHIGEDIVKCIVIRPSIVFRYHVGRQTLYMIFHYGRFWGPANGTWDAIEHEVNVDMESVQCTLQGRNLPLIEVGKSWPISHLCHEIAIMLEAEVPDECKLVLVEPSWLERKVSCWQYHCKLLLLIVSCSTNFVLMKYFYIIAADKQPK